MVRPRWHDALIAAAIAGLLAVGVWAMWWEDVRSILHLSPGEAGDGDARRTAPSAQT
jgi:hypothetical protein